MDYRDHEVGKMVAEKLAAEPPTMPWPQPPSRIGGAPQQQYAMCNEASPRSRPSLAEQAEKQAAYHGEQIDKYRQSAEFLRAHPEFETFIELLRKGALQI